MIIKNGKVVLFENEDVIVKDVDLKIENSKIVRIERNIEAEDGEKIVNAKDKVKVYLFEAGGCPYCVKEEEYLKGLDGYDKTFTIVKKELYVDHVDWAEGKDYALGKKVAKAFNSFGFEDASHEATPFVVISDLYAASAYNTSLESVINEAYENGDKDIVKCYEDGKDNCLDHLKKDTSSSSKNYTPVIIITGLVILITYLVKSSIDTKNIIKNIDNINVKKR